MKRIRSFIIGLLACAVCGVLAYHFGYNRALRSQIGPFIVSLSAVQNLRAGDIGRATRQVEAVCFGSAELLYNNPAFRKDQVIVMFAPELKEYRAAYRTNNAEWSAVETNLDKDLSGVK